MDYVIADLHIGHENLITKYKIRPFQSLEEMHGTIIANWNKVVKKHDNVYILGDICLSNKYLHLVDELYGHKYLVLGNHDLLSTQNYLKLKNVNKLYGILHLSKYSVILSHAPLHESTFNRKGWEVNIHGHLHDKKLHDPRYVCVSCEQVNYTPVNIESLITR